MAEMQGEVTYDCLDLQPRGGVRNVVCRAAKRGLGNVHRDEAVELSGGDERIEKGPGLVGCAAAKLDEDRSTGLTGDRLGVLSKMSRSRSVG
jgi:hypothetical protein